MIILFPAALLKWFDCNSCAIYGTSKHEKCCLTVKQTFFVLYLTHLDVVGFIEKEEEGRGEGKGKPEGDGKKIMRIMLGKICAK